MLRHRTADDPGRAAAVLAGVRAYQQAPRPAPLSPAPALATAGRASLRDHGGSGPPVVIVPSLINGPEILDLDARRSLVRWLARADARVLLVDWGEPAAAERERTLGGHVADLLLPLLDALGEPAALVGYCLGGTLALAAAALRPVRGVATLAAPWRFAGYPAQGRADLAALWEQARGDVARLGLMPLDVMQAAFWQLDPERVLDKFAALARDTPDADALRDFAVVEDWVNAGPPLTAAAASELFALFEADLTGRGGWRIGGVPIVPERWRCPLLEIVALPDRIVPPEAAAGTGARLDVPLGHVGMIVGRRAEATVWQPLAAWLRRLDG